MASPPPTISDANRKRGCIVFIECVASMSSRELVEDSFSALTNLASVLLISVQEGMGRPECCRELENLLQVNMRGALFSFIYYGVRQLYYGRRIYSNKTVREPMQDRRSLRLTAGAGDSSAATSSRSPDEELRQHAATPPDPRHHHC